MTDLDALLARLKMVMDTHPDDGGQVLLADGVEDCYEAITRLRADLAQRTADLERMTGQRNAALDAREITQRTLDGIDGVLSQRTAERDEARRSACMVKARYLESIDGFPRPTDDEIGIKARAIARGMRWDCFEKEAKP